MNMKKIVLLTLLAAVISTKAFAYVGVGIIGGVDVNTNADWRLGLTLGLGVPEDNPVIVNVLLNGGYNTFSIKPTFDWHILTWNISIVQIYLGLGVGTEFDFGTSDTDLDPFKFTLAARVPVGVKIIADETLEFFFEMSPQFGWRNYSRNISYGSNKRIDFNSFYWDVGLYTGFRAWF